MNISLTREFEELIQQKVKEGSYATASEVVREALRLFKEREQLRQLQLEELRREVQKGIDAAERGEVSDWDPEKFRQLIESRRKVAKRA